MQVRIQISSENTTISERANSHEKWGLVLTGNSNNLTMMARRLLESEENVIREYSYGENIYDDKGTEEFILEGYKPILEDPKIYGSGTSQYTLSKLLQSA